ncbi:MAG: RNA polymerase sigma factor [Lacipirellulaceae bacterium]
MRIPRPTPIDRNAPAPPPGAAIPCGALQAADGELLALFARHGDERAFDRLVERHGPMVWRVCKRVLRNDHDAEDAFQASFLLLARHGRRVRVSESLAGWLYRVAFRTALAARKRRLRLREAPLADEPPSREPRFPDFVGRQAQSILLEELAALPHKYRTVLVLRYIEGRSRREIADDTDQTIASVQGRLARGTRLLRSRVVRRGVSLAVAVAAFNGARQATACPTSIAASATRDASALVTGKALGASAGAVSLYQQGVRAMLVSSIGKPLAGAAAATLMVLATIAPRAAGEGGAAADAPVALSASVAEGFEGESPADGGVQLAAAEVAIEERPMEERVVEKEPVEQRRVEERVVERQVVERPITDSAGPTFRPEDLRSQERLSWHANRLRLSVEALNERVEQFYESAISPDIIAPFEAKRDRILQALFTVETHLATLETPDAYIDAILATAPQQANGPPTPAVGAAVEMPRVPFVEVPQGFGRLEVELPRNPPLPPPVPPSMPREGVSLRAVSPIEMQLEALTNAERQIVAQRQTLERQLMSAGGNPFVVPPTPVEVRVPARRFTESPKIEQSLPAEPMKKGAERAKQRAFSPTQTNKVSWEQLFTKNDNSNGFGSLGLVEHAVLASQAAADSAEQMVASHLISRPEKDKSIARVRRELNIANRLLEHWEQCAADAESYPGEDLEAPSSEEKAKAEKLRAELKKVDARRAAVVDAVYYAPVPRPSR